MLHNIETRLVYIGFREIESFVAFYTEMNSIFY